MKCQILFSGKNKKNNIILSSAENAQRVVKVDTGLKFYVTCTILEVKVMDLEKIYVKIFKI